MAASKLTGIDSGTRKRLPVQSRRKIVRYETEMEHSRHTGIIKVFLAEVGTLEHLIWKSLARELDHLC